MCFVTVEGYQQNQDISIKVRVRASKEILPERNQEGSCRCQNSSRTGDQLGSDWGQCCSCFSVDTERERFSRVEIARVRDKRQITITVAGTLSGKLLPYQPLYEGIRQSGAILQLFSLKGLISGTCPIIGLMARHASDLWRISFFRTFCNMQGSWTRWKTYYGIH